MECRTANSPIVDAHGTKVLDPLGYGLDRQGLIDREKGQFVLKPANKAYPVIRPRGQMEIFGVMAGLVRKIR